jgi:hypothetical protein
MKMHGLDIANEVAQFELENFDALTHIVETEGIDCDLTSVTSCAAFVDEGEAVDAKSLWDDMLRRGSPALKHVAYHGPADAEKMSGVKGAVALYTFPAAVMW